MTNKKPPFSRKAKGVFEQGEPVPSPFDEAKDHTIDGSDFYQNRDNKAGGFNAPVKEEAIVQEQAPVQLQSQTPSEEEIASEGGSVGGVALEGTTAPSRTPEGVQYTGKHGKRQKKGLLEPNDMSFDTAPVPYDEIGLNPIPVKKEHDEDMHLTDYDTIIRKWFGWFNVQQIAAMGVYMHDNIVMTDWICTYTDKPAVYNGWVSDFMGNSSTECKIGEPLEIMEDMWKVDVLMKQTSAAVYYPSTNTMVEPETKEWGYQCVFEFDLPVGDNYPKVMKITRKKNK